MTLLGLFGILLLSNASPKMEKSHDRKKGILIFNNHCSGCHGAKGEGAFGPNLTDNYFLHGTHMHNVVHIVRHGHKNGMTAFGHALSHRQIHDVAHYVLSLKNTNVPGGKAPQGKKN